MSEKYEHRKILQIIPASGWLAQMNDNGEGVRPLWSVACWALVELENGERDVVGMMGGDFLDFVDVCSDFNVYVHEDELTDKNARLANLKD